MLDTVFMQVLNMTITAGVVIIAVLAARLLLKKVPKAFSYALWAVVLFRLLCPISIEAPVSIVPQIGPVAASYTLADENVTVAGASEAAYQAVGDALNGGLGVQHIRTAETDEAGHPVYAVSLWWEVWVLFGQYVWLAGIAGMLIYSAVSYFHLRRKLVGAARLRDNIYLADHIGSPFVMGLFRPKIFLPSTLDEKERSYIILHEQHHIRRLDHVVKLLSFTALCIHWFNPLVWVAFILSGKDMEMSCDEAVVKKMGMEIRADYSASLLTLATGRRIIAGTPLAFGEGDTKGRIKNLARWKKPAVWIVILAAAACAVLGVCLLTNPADSSDTENREDRYYLVVGADGVANIEISTPDSSGGCQHADGSLFQKGEEVWLEPLDNITDLRGVSITALNEDGDILYSFSAPMTASDSEITELVGKDGWLLAPTGTGVSPAGGADDPGAVETVSTLDDVISAAILDYYASDEPDGLIHVESHVLLADEVRSGTPLAGQKNHMEEATVYLVVLQQKYSVNNGVLDQQSGSFGPVAITFSISAGGEYTLKEFWEPRDGSYYADDIRDKFPGAAADDALKHQAYLEELDAQCESKALACLNSTGGLGLRIAGLLDVIQSSPAASSNPDDYIRAHNAEYQELLGYGEFTLRYCFGEFLKGGQTDLRGHIMARVCEEISNSWGEGLLIDAPAPVTGQDWFDAFRGNAERLAEQYSGEDMEKVYPASWLIIMLTRNAQSQTDIRG